MAVSMGQPAPQSGDIKVLKSVTGTIAAGGAAVVEAESFSLPILAAGQILVSNTLIARTAGAENTGIVVSATSASLTGDINKYSGALDKMESYTTIQPSQVTAGRVCFINVNHLGQSSEEDSVDLGDVSAAHTIYLNIQRQAASTFKYIWTLYLIGSGVK